MTISKGGLRLRLSSDHNRRNGGRAQSAALLSIEGESLTTDQIAARLQCSSRSVGRWLQQLRTEPGPVTWAALRKKAGDNLSDHQAAQGGQDYE